MVYFVDYKLRRRNLLAAFLKRERTSSDVGEGNDLHLVQQSKEKIPSFLFRKARLLDKWPSARGGRKFVASRFLEYF